MNKALLLTIKSEFADMIFAGTKSIELRRRRPQVAPGDYLIIYVPAPFKRIVGVVMVKDVIEARIHTLWRKVRAECGIPQREFLSYFCGVSVGFGISLARPARLGSPVPLEALRAIEPNFSPQGYKYLSRGDITDVIGRLRPCRGSGDRINTTALFSGPTTSAHSRRVARLEAGVGQRPTSQWPRRRPKREPK